MTTRIAAASLIVLPLLGCTTSRSDSALSVCARHFSHPTRAVRLTVAHARPIGGPHATGGAPTPLAGYADNDRVVRCLVPTGADSAQVVDIVERTGTSYIRWTQQGRDATREFMPPA